MPIQMNPRMNGKFKEMKECVCELLDPVGELATAAGAFDVVAFSSGAWSWSSTFASRMNLLAASQTFHTGRQVGGKPRPGSSRIREHRAASWVHASGYLLGACFASARALPPSVCLTQPCCALLLS